MTKSQQRRAEILAGKTRYLHISVLVGTAKMVDPVSGIEMTVPTRTPKGKGGTARKVAAVEQIIDKARASV